MRLRRLNLRFLLVLAAILLVAGGGLAVSHQLRKRSAAGKALAAGKAALDRRDWPQAISQLRQYLSRFPDDPEVLLQVARAQLEIRPLERQNQIGAVQTYRRYLRLRPDDREVAHELGRLYVDCGELNEAAYIYRRLIEDAQAASVAGGRAVKDPQAWVGLARALMLQGKHAEALGEPDHGPLRVLLTRYPHVPEGYVLMGTLVEKEFTPAVRDAAADVLWPETRDPLTAQPAGTQPATTQPSTGPAEPPYDSRAMARALLDLGMRRNPDSALLRVHRARFRRLAARGAGREEAELEGAKADLEAADRLRPRDPNVLFSLFDEWYEPGYARVAPDHLARAGAELDALAELDAGTLAAHHHKLEDVQFSILLGRARLALRMEDAASRLALADRWRALAGDEKRRFLPFAVRLYLLAGEAGMAEDAVKAYKAEVEDMLGVNQAVRDSVTLLDASLAWAQGRWYDVINLVEPIVRSGRTVGTAPAPGLLTGAYAATGQHRRLLHLVEIHGKHWLDDPGVLHAAVASCMALSRWADAERYARLLERLEPESLNARLLRIQAGGAVLAGSRAAARETSELLKETATLKQAHPARLDIRLLEAELLFNSDRKDDAIGCLKTAARECENPLAARLKMIEYLRGMDGRGEEALAACRAAMEEHPESAALRGVWADLLVAAGKKAEALASLEQAEKDFARLEQEATEPTRRNSIREEKVSISRLLAGYKLDQGDRAGGVRLLEELARARPSDLDVRAQLLRVSWMIDDPGKAQPLIDEMRRIEGEEGVQWRIAQARIWLQGLNKSSTDSGELRRREEITSCLTQCIESDPSWEEPVLLLGRMFEELEQDGRAEELYRGWLQDHTGNPTVTNRLLALLQRQKRAAEMATVLKELPDDDRSRILQERYGASIQVSMGDYDKAIAGLEEKIRKDPGDLPAYVLLAALYQTHRQDADGALKLLDQALRVNPDFFDAFSAKVAILYSLGREDEAVRLTTDEIGRRKDFQVYKLRADLYTILGKPDLAEQDLIQLAALKESKGRGHVLLGSFYEANGRQDQAIAVWEQGLAIHPENRELADKLVQALVSRPDRESQDKGRQMLDRMLPQRTRDSGLLMADARYWLTKGGEAGLAKARSSLEEAVRANPRNIAAQVMLINVAMRQAAQYQQVDQTRELIARALAANRDSSELLMLLAEFEADRGNLAAAEEAAISAIEADPQSVDALNLATKLALRARQTDKAARHNDQALRMRAENEPARLLHARILDARGAREEALKYLESYCQTDRGRNSVGALLTLAEMYQAAGRPEAGAEQIEKAAAIAPGSPAVLNARLLALAAGRRFGEIRPLAEASLSSGPNDVPLLLSGATVLARAGKEYLEEAMALYRKVLDLEPYQPDALNNLAWLMAVEMGRPREALEQYADPGVTRYPNNPHLLDTRGRIHILLNQYELARADLEKCVLLAGHLPATHCSALLGLGRVYSELDERQMARTSLLKARQIDGNTKVMTDAQRADLDRLLSSLEGA